MLKLNTAVWSICLGVTLLPGEAVASLGDGSITERKRPDPVPSDFNFSRHGGFLIFDKKGKLVCGNSGLGPIDAPACDQDKMRMAEVHRPRNVAARVKPEKTAAIPFVALGLASLACGAAGFITASLVEQQNTILVVHHTTAAQTAVMSAGGLVQSVRASGQIVRHALPHANLATRSVARAGVGGAICAASAGAGYAVFHFFFRRDSDLGEPAR